mgnify:CR=1 FL=1
MDRIVEFELFGKDKTVVIESKNDPKKQLEVVQIRPSYFEVYQKGKLKAELDFNEIDIPSIPKSIELLEKPYFGVTFLGVGSGFSHNRENSCLILWAEGKGIMVDAFSDNSEAMLAQGVTENDISYMFLFLSQGKQPFLAHVDRARKLGELTPVGVPFSERGG